MIGQLPRYSPILLPDIGECNISKQCLSQRLYLLHRLEDFHENLLKKGFSPPRETWETWVTDVPMNNCTDVVFMYLLIIIMSSSTSDAQLANFIPKLLPWVSHVLVWFLKFVQFMEWIACAAFSLSLVSFTRTLRELLMHWTISCSTTMG